MKLTVPAALVLLSLSACGNTPAIVSDFNGDSVKVVTNSMETTEYQRSVAGPEAQRICQTRGKKAEYASTRTNSQTYESEHLYLCM